TPKMSSPKPSIASQVTCICGLAMPAELANVHYSSPLRGWLRNITPPTSSSQIERMVPLQVPRNVLKGMLLHALRDVLSFTGLPLESWLRAFRAWRRPRAAREGARGIGVGTGEQWEPVAPARRARREAARIPTRANALSREHI